MLHQIKGIENIDSPALVVIHETVIKNIDEMVNKSPRSKKKD
jgi:hypothetical protein